MPQLLYEAWHDPDDNSLECSRANSGADELRRRISPGARLVRSYLASSHEDAMQQHYTAEGWGEYKRIPGHTDIPHTQQEFLDQQAWLQSRKL